MPLESALDRLHARAVGNRWLHPFAAFCRLALAVGFIAPGLTKLLGQRFAYWSTATPAGSYFDALYHTGAYYRFIGLAQVVAAVLLLFRRTAALGAVLYFPIILNIFVFTYALGFEEFHLTTVVTTLMLLACLFLLGWEYPRWKGLLVSRVTPDSRVDTPTSVGKVAWWLAAVSGIVLTSNTRDLLPRSGAVVLWFGALALFTASILLGGWAGWLAWKRPR